MNYFRLYENWLSNQNEYIRVDKSSTSLVQIKLDIYEEIAIYDKNTYDNLLKSKKEIAKLLSKMNTTEIFETIIGLTKNGLRNFEAIFYPSLKKEYFSQDIKSFERSIKIRKEILEREEHFE